MGNVTQNNFLGAIFQNKSAMAGMEIEITVACRAANSFWLGTN